MTYSLSNNCTKNYYHRTLTVQVIVEDVVTWIFFGDTVYISPIVSAGMIKYFKSFSTTRDAKDGQLKQLHSMNYRSLHIIEFHI